MSRIVETLNKEGRKELITERLSDGCIKLTENEAKQFGLVEENARPGTIYMLSCDETEFIIIDQLGEQVIPKNQSLSSPASTL